VKKSINIFTAWFLIIGFLFIGCLGNDDDSPSAIPGSELIGSWDITGMTVNGTIVPDMFLPDWTTTFNGDNTGSHEIDGRKEDFEWSVSGDELTLTDEDGESETVKYSVSGKICTITTQDYFDEDDDIDTIVITFEKQT